MDKDVTGFSGMLNAWIPQKVQEKLSPIVDKAEETIANVNGIVRNSIRNNVSQLVAKNMSLNNQVMDRIDAKITPIEGRIDSLNKKILDKIETPLFPIESKTAIGSLFTCDTTPKPIGNGRCVIDVCDPIQGTIIGQENIPCPTGNGGGILDHPVPTECPPQQECPPQKDCPPQSCIYVDLYLRHCKENDDKCTYFVLSGYGPLSKQDTLIAAQLTCDSNAQFEWTNSQNFCKYIKPCDVKPGQPMPPIGGQLENCCPPGGVIVNIPKPPEGGGLIINEMPGSIINITPPTVPFEPPTYPPITFPSNVVMLQINACPTDDKGKPKCMPSGDYSRVIQDCGDDQNELAFSSAIYGKTVDGELQGQLVGNWFQDKVKELIDESIPDFDFMSGDNLSLG